MFEFNEPDLSRNPTLPVIRIARGQTATLLIKTNSSVTVMTHFLQRSILCLGDDNCPACEQSIPRRGLRYTIASVNGLMFITALPADAPEGVFRAGQEVFISRSKRNNGLKYQLGLFKSDTSDDFSEDMIWRVVLNLHRVKTPATFGCYDESDVRIVRQQIMQQLESALVHTQRSGRKESK